MFAPSSIRWRFLWWLALLLALLLAGFGVTAWRLSQFQQIKSVDDELQQLAARVAGDMRTPRGAPPGLRDREWPGSKRLRQEERQAAAPERSRKIVPPIASPAASPSGA